MSFDDLVLITGGTGFAGRHLVNHLAAAGYTNIHVTYIQGLPTDWDPQLPVTFHQLDLTDAATTKALVGELQPAQLYQLAAIAIVGKSFENGAMILKNNMILQHNILEAVRQASPQTRFLSIGSAEEYGFVDVPEDILEANMAGHTPLRIDEKTALHPINPYAVSKVTQDLLAEAYYFSFQLNILRARPFNHIGTGQTPDFVVPAFASQIANIEKGNATTLKKGNVGAVRDFSDVRDVAAAYVTIMEKGQIGEIYNIGSGRGWKISEILDTLIKFAKVEIHAEPDESRFRSRDVPYFVANSDKLMALGWKPTRNIEQTLEEILNEWRTRV